MAGGAVMGDGSGSGSDPGGIGYRCYLLDVDDSIARRVDLVAEDDVGAIAEARGILSASAHPAAEVWYLSRMILRILSGR